MTPKSVGLAEATEVGTLGGCLLKRMWSRAMAARQGHTAHNVAEQKFESRVLDALGLGLAQTHEYLMQTGPSFDEFERWVARTTGGVETEVAARINAVVKGEELPAATQRRIAEIDAMESVLSAEDLAHWDEQGYVILHDAVPEESRLAAERAIWAHLNAQPDKPDSWYGPTTHGIMVQLFQHPAFTANRRSARIHKAFAQLWGTADLWVSCDRVGFNVPERPDRLCNGPDLHWDVSLARPIPFCTQGILYLTDTPMEQGAFTCVPGFHRRIDAWLDSLSPNANPREQDLHAFGSKPIAGRAGDLVIWEHKLPHGSRPNRGKRPRIVQYINMLPTHFDVRDEWI